MIDAVLSYHLNGATCGVAKFNQQLAQFEARMDWLVRGRGLVYERAA